MKVTRNGVTLDSFHNAMSELSWANMNYNIGNPGHAIFNLRETKKYIDKLIKEIPDE